MNALTLYHDLKKRGVLLEADGHRLRVDAPTGVLVEQDRAALAELKLLLLKFLAGTEKQRDDGRRFKAEPSKHLGYTALYDPVSDEWHDFPTWDCFPFIVEEAKGRGERGGRGGVAQVGGIE